VKCGYFTGPLSAMEQFLLHNILRDSAALSHEIVILSVSLYIVPIMNCDKTAEQNNYSAYKMEAVLYLLYIML